MLVAGSAPAKRYTIVGIVKFGGGESFGGAGAAAADAGRGPARRRRAGPLRPDRRRRRARRHAGAAARAHPRRAARAPWTCAPARSRPPRTPPTSKTTSASCARSCLSSPTSRCRRRVHHLQHLLDHRRPAHAGVRAAAHARRLARGRSCARSSPKACCSESSAPCSGCSRASALAPALDELFKAFGADLPDSGTVLETRTIVVSLLVGIDRHGARRPARRRCAPRASRRWRRCARASRSRRASLTRRGLIVRGSLHRGRSWWSSRALAHGRRARCRRRVRDPGARYGWSCACARGSRSAAATAVVPALAQAIGVLVALARDHRPPGTGELDAPARPHDGHRRSAHGRARAGRRSSPCSPTALKATIDHAVSRSFAGNLIVENSQAWQRRTGHSGRWSPRRCARCRGWHRVTPIAFTVGRPRGTSDNAIDHGDRPEHVRKRLPRSNGSKARNATLAGLQGGGTIATKSYAKAHHLTARAGDLRAHTRQPARLADGASASSTKTRGCSATSRSALPLARAAFGQREDALDFVAYAPGADQRAGAARGRQAAREPASRRRARAPPRSSSRTRPTRSTRCWR